MPKKTKAVLIALIGDETRPIRAFHLAYNAGFTWSVWRENEGRAYKGCDFVPGVYRSRARLGKAILAAVHYRLIPDTTWTLRDNHGAIIISGGGGASLQDLHETVTARVADGTVHFVISGSLARSPRKAGS